MHREWLPVLVLLGAFPALTKDTPDGGTPGAAVVRKVLAPEFKAALDKARASGRFTLIDVREPSETAAGFVEGAELMPLTSGVFARERGKIPKDRPVLVYCGRGSRALRAAEILVADGWKDVTALSPGGYEDLQSPPPR